jgi:hypothetical protein
MFLLWKIDLWIMNVFPQELVIKPVINFIIGDYGIWEEYCIVAGMALVRLRA